MRISTIVFFVFLSFSSWAQLVNNKSFEGANRPNRSPSFWYPCSPESTPDTQPFAYGVTLPADDGNTYIGLVTRSLSFDPFEIQEDVETRLNIAMEAGFPYQLNISLARSNDMGYDDAGTIVVVNTPIRLRVYGGTASCQKDELLWESPTIESTAWEKLEVIIRPEADKLRYLILEAAPSGNTIVNGNILIDNINLKEEPVVIPTVFTPNGDGFNDLFFVKGLMPFTELEIVSRDGKTVVETKEYKNDWDGNDWPAGVYFYSMKNDIKKRVWKGEVSIMR